MLRLGKYDFQEDLSKRQSSLMFFPADEDEGASYSFECGFLRGNFGDEEISPSICINSIETECCSAAELAGQNFSADNIKECNEREDTFCIFEHEPLYNYTITIKEIKNGMAVVQCVGRAIIDGYDKKLPTVDFSMEVRVPVIEDKRDWDKFEF